MNVYSNGIDWFVAKSQSDLEELLEERFGTGGYLQSVACQGRFMRLPDESKLSVAAAQHSERVNGRVHKIYEARDVPECI